MAVNVTLPPVWCTASKDGQTMYGVRGRRLSDGVVGVVHSLRSAGRYGAYFTPGVETVRHTEQEQVSDVVLTELYVHTDVPAYLMECYFHSVMILLSSDGDENVSQLVQRLALEAAHLSCLKHEVYNRRSINIRLACTA